MRMERPRPVSLKIARTRAVRPPAREPGAVVVAAPGPVPVMRSDPSVDCLVGRVGSVVILSSLASLCQFRNEFGHFALLDLRYRCRKDPLGALPAGKRDREGFQRVE